MLHEDEIQNELLDRLADGELPDDDYRQLIHRLEDTPDGWRRCALSFLEQQALQRDLRQLLKDGQRLDLEDDALAGLDEDVEQTDSPHVSAPDRWERWFGQPWVRWTSVLAVGILAFVGGVAFHPFGSSDGGSSALPTDAFAKRSRAPAVNGTLLVDDALAGSARTLHVPILNVADGNNIPKFATEQLPPQLVTVLHESANPNRIERRVYFLRTEDGRIFILPIDRVVQRANFQ